MARRKEKEKNIRKLTRLGGTSLGVTIPIEMVRKLKWRERQPRQEEFGGVKKVVARPAQLGGVKLRGNKITIEDWEK